MARMIPARFDESTSSHAERLLYYRLQDYLADDWTVLHSLPWLDGGRPRLQEGECDFLLLHPRHGMLVLEAKSGTPQYDGPSGTWRHDDGTRLTDPFTQARRAAHHLNAELCERSAAWRQASLAFGYAVAFPDASAVRGELRPDMDPRLFLLEPDLDDLQGRVARILALFSDPAPAARPEAVAGALEVLQPSFRLVATLAPVVESANRELVRLTEEQAWVLEGMTDNARLVVRGGAGTGKTLLAAAGARRAAAAGRRTLVLCFNRCLASHLRGLLAAAGDAVAVATFHDHCLSLLAEAGVAPPPDHEPGRWERIADEALAALPGTRVRWDAVLVDEAQDFAPDWWLLVEELLADRARSSFHLFLDDRQNLYGREAQLPFSGPEFRLRRNCRNTAPIAEFSRRAIGLAAGEDPAALPDGPAPVICEVVDAAGEREGVRKALHELVHEQGLAPAQVVVLGAHRLDKSSLAGIRKLGNLELVDADDPGAGAPGTVRYATVHKFKGLEADAVILVGIGEPSRVYGPEEWRRFTYVGASRARVVLRVFARPGALGPAGR